MLVLITDATDGTWLTYVPCDSRQICHDTLSLSDHDTKELP